MTANPITAPAPAISLVLFDFGGVVAEEGFRDGLAAIAATYNIDPPAFHQQAVEIIGSSGYLTGTCSEARFWNQLRSATGIGGTDDSLRRKILSRFTLRPWMLTLAQSLREQSIATAMLSDQTNWLDELNEADHFFSSFDRIFNSYHLGISKFADPAIYLQIVKEMKHAPATSLFIDDNPKNISDAHQQGLHTICYQDRAAFEKELAAFLPAGC
ncbi:MAG: HAD family phosphatase [Deltaproteobacteria bacterium]|nr:HAD family phosphatase [Deltaproteobacteria bacterium]